MAGTSPVDHMDPVFIRFRARNPHVRVPALACPLRLRRFALKLLGQTRGPEEEAGVLQIMSSSATNEEACRHHQECDSIRPGRIEVPQGCTSRHVARDVTIDVGVTHHPEPLG